MKKTSMGVFAAGLALVGYAFGTAAMADDGMRQMGRKGFDVQMFAQADANGDGLISVEELQAQQALKFTAADTDGNGVLSAEELLAQKEAERAAREAQMGQMMLSRLDKNGDGSISADEMPQPDFTRLMSKLDTDNDGMLSTEELEAMQNRFADRKGHHEGRGGHGKWFGRDKS